MKKWIIKQNSSQIVSGILNRTDLTSLCVETLVARGVFEVEDIADYFQTNELSEPFLLKDMHDAVDCIRSSIDNDELICIYGDYDCDGVTSTAILYNYLTCIGARVMYYIPEREEGFGLNEKAVQYIYDASVQLIITVDNGISAINEAKLIKKLGMKLVITDHHQPEDELPDAYAVVNPNRKDCISPYKNLAGVGVALKLIAALDDGNYDIVMEQYADIAAIGTIADVAEITGENRTIVKRGLQLLSCTENYGLRALMEKANIKFNNITSTSVAFMLAPRINAAGRFGSPTTALKLFIDEDSDYQALADELVSLNNQRKKTEDIILNEILDIIKENPQILDQRVIVVWGDNWHHGVVGIVCSRLLERFSKPVYLISVTENEARGSARGIDGFSIVASLQYCKDVLTKSGGHTLAGGFSLAKENLEIFRDKLYKYALEYNTVMPIPTITADKMLRADDFSIDNIEGLKLLEPFGQGNSVPLFAMIGARVDKISALSNGRHSKIEITYDGIKLFALLFNCAPEDFSIAVGEQGDFLVNLDINEYKGNKTVSVIVKDYRKSGIKQEQYFAAKSCYECIKRKEKVDKNLLERAIPSRDDLVMLYKILMVYKNPVTVDTIFMKIFDKMNYCKLKLCLDIFDEIGLIKLDLICNSICYLPVTQKVDIENSTILRKLRCL